MALNRLLASAIGLLLLTMVAASFTLALRALVRLAQGRPVFPEQEERPAVLSTADVLHVLLVWVVFHLGMPLALGLARSAVAWDQGVEAAEPLSPLAQMQLISVANALLLLVLSVSLIRRTGGRFARAYLNGRSLATRLGQGTVACLTVAPLVFGINMVLILLTQPLGHPLMKMVQDRPSLWVALLAVLSGGILAPIAEELMFRGALLPWLARPRQPAPTPGPGEASGPEPTAPDPAEAESNPFAAPASTAPYIVPGPDPADEGPQPRLEWKANVVASLLFATVHLTQWPAPIPIFVLSLALGRLYMRTGSLVAVMAMHAVFNSISTLTLFLQVLNPPAA